MSRYTYSRKTVQSYIQSLYRQNLQQSRYLNPNEIEELIRSIGIFKFKGYVYAFKADLHYYSIDDVLIVYFFDKYLSKLLMDMTSSIETKLKTVLVELCYKHLNSLPNTHPQKDNPFFYLIAQNYKTRTDRRTGSIIPPKLTGPSVQNWRNRATATNDTQYLHYGLYYKNKYDFASNKSHYLHGMTLLHTYPDINYPPFHYFVESSTLGTVIYLIKNLKIGRYDLLEKVAREFGINNTRRINFAPYLERLNEIRNRAAHRERLFNRSYQSVARVGHFRSLSNPRTDHRFIDVYIYLFFMLGEIDRFKDRDDFMKDEIKRLFRGFKSDYYIRVASKRLTKKMKRKAFIKVENFILKGME